MLGERERSTVEIPVEGMTCASCVRRVEKALGKVEGVEEASVNLATEKARVSYPVGLPVEDLLTTVEQAGYRADLPAPPVRADAAGTASVDELAPLRQRLLVSALLTVPVVAMAMVPKLIQKRRGGSWCARMQRGIHGRDAGKRLSKMFGPVSSSSNWRR